MPESQEQDNIEQSQTTNIPAYNADILKAFEYFLAQEEDQKQLIFNLISDFKSITKNSNQEESGSLSLKTVVSLVIGFIKVPKHTWNLLKFYRNQEKYNTPEFRQALLESDETWKFVDRTADNIEQISTLMTNIGIDLFQEGKPLDTQGISRIKGALKNPDFISSLKEFAIASNQKKPNYLKLASQLLDTIDKAPNASAFLSEKGESIKAYIITSIGTQIEQEKALRDKWNEISVNPDKQQEHAAKIKFLTEAGIQGKAGEDALEHGILPKTLQENITEYGLQVDDINNILKIVPVLLDSPRELKSIIDAIDDGKYTDIARQVIELAENKPEIKRYLEENHEIFEKIITSTLQSNEHFANSGLGGQIYNLVPALFNNPKALNEILDIYDKGNYYELAPKIFGLVANDPEIRKYFSEHAEGFEKLTTGIIQDTINKSRQSLETENAEWQALSNEEKKLYLDNNSKWKDFSDFEKERMVKRGRLQDLGETLAIYGVDEENINTISHLATLTLNNPEHLSTILGDFAKGDYTSMAQNAFKLFNESSEVNKFLLSEKTFINKIVKTNLLNTPALSNIDVTDLVPFLLNHPNELQEIIGLVRQEKYDDIAPKILELAKEDREIADYLAKNKSTLTKAALSSTGFDQYGLSEEVSDIFIHLTSENNLPKLQKLAELAAKEEWIKVGAGLADLIDQGQEFRSSLSQNRENINKIIDIVLLKNPSLRSSISALETGDLANNILSDPGGVRDLLNAYESGNKTALATQIAKFTTKKIFDSEFRGAIYNSAINWVYGKGNKQQELGRAIANAISNRNNLAERIILSDFIKNAFTEIAENIESQEVKIKFLKQINNKNFFEGIIINGSIDKPLQFHNLDINGNQFVNTTFKNVYF